MKVAIGLSGGVDSAVAALKLLEDGHEVVAITMRIWRGAYRGGERAGCFGPGEAESIARAAAVAGELGVPHRVLDCSAEYEETVVKYFRETYLSGRTPNPCVLCNALMKFGLLPQLAAEAGIAFDRFATGHYARVGEEGGRMLLRRASDGAKDQSYFLCRLSQSQLRRQLFPLGDLCKEEVRSLAARRGLAAADRPDSQDFYTGDKAELIGAEDRPGNFVDVNGKVLGRHRGFWHYTVGQRKGLGLGGGGTPWYVLDLNACRNEVTVGRAEEAVRTSLSVADMNWVSLAPTAAPVECLVKVRSAGRLVPATLENGRAEFPSGIAGIAPGQSAVFYSPDGDRVLCAGEIVS